MAIPPKEGHYTPEDFQVKVDKAIADMQWISSQLAAMKAHPELAKAMFPDPAKPDDGLPVKPPGGSLGDKPGPGKDNDKDKAPAYGMKK